MIIYHFTQADLASLIKKAVYELEPLAKTKNIDIETKVHNDLPPIKIDAERILQVLRNLIGNALKFTSNGGNVQVTAQANEHGQTVSITDTGVGISEEELSNIFDKYKQARIGTPNKIMGSGLGLYIVKQIITAHGGKVWAESTAGKGSSFTFILPS
ncbi:MAG: sensor histidine kinase [bacterium]